MERSLRSTQHSVPSLDGALIATLQKTHLVIRSSTTGKTIQSWALPQDFTSNCKHFEWSGSSNGGDAHDANERSGAAKLRVLVADDDTVRIYDAFDSKWLATVDGASGSLGKIAHVAFGHSSKEILIFSDFGVKVTIWSLTTSRGIEIKDPKYNVPCYNYRPHTGHLALLTRALAKDILIIMNPDSHEVVRSVELPTVDAQGVKWSRDGQWLAVKDAASTGDRVLIYTADGHLFKMYTGPQYGTDIGLGVKRVCFGLANIMLIGDYGGHVTILAKNTFSPVAICQHPYVIELPGITVWQEQINAAKQRSYVLAPQPASLPTSASLAKTMTPKHGISMMILSQDGALLATKNDSCPTTAWIWSLQTGRTIAILIHHCPIKQLIWHPTIPDLLLMHCAIAEPTMHIWKADWEVPRTITLPFARANGRLEVSWLQSLNDHTLRVMISSAHQYATAEISESGELLAGAPNLEGGGAAVAGAEDMFDEGNSFDLSPVKFGATGASARLTNDTDSGFGLNDELLDDTFHYRRQIKASG